VAYSKIIKEICSFVAGCPTFDSGNNHYWSEQSTCPHCTEIRQVHCNRIAALFHMSKLI